MNYELITSLFIGTITVFILGSLISLISPTDKLANIFSNTFAAIGSSLGIATAAILLLTKTTISFSIPTTFPILNLSIMVDQLAAFFILIISVVALACSIYGFGYMRHYFGKYNIQLFGFLYNLFIASLLLVVTASNGLYFLITWELMSLTSYFLVIYEYKKRENVQAGLLYLVMTHMGTLFITIAFFSLFLSTGSFDFQIIKNQHIPTLIQNIVFICAVIGFGTKAGIIPFHIWLPRAHPAAPSQVSALMSGVMIKTAIYMMIRLFLDVLPQPPLWWGITILVLGAISSLLGVLYAISEHDIKRLLAYHSVENIGIILMGLGSGIIFLSLKLPVLALIGIVAALYHTMNHAIFKSLLFLGAGSVVAQTHTGNMEEYGGLIKRMPSTAIFFLIGAVSISALPPFNGFASEWLTYQSLIAGLSNPVLSIKIVYAAAIASLAFTGGLAAACFVKAFGAIFLAQPRSEEAAHAKESHISLLIGMFIPAVLTLILGVFASTINPILGSISQSLELLKTVNVSPITPQGVVYIGNRVAFIDGYQIFLILLVVSITIITGIYILTRQRRVAIRKTWDCGAPFLTPRAEITATSFSRSLITMFGGILRPSKQRSVEYLDVESRYFTMSKTITVETPNLYEAKIYRPIQNILDFITIKVAKVQSGNLNQYLLYILVTLITLLIWGRFYK